MTYTNQEMIFFNSLLDRKTIFGLQIESPLIADEDYINSTISSLQEKNIIDINHKLIEKSSNPIFFLDLYKKSNKYIIFNNKRIALIGETFSSVIQHDEDQFEIFTISRKGLLIEIIKNTPLLLNKGFSWIPEPPKHCTFEDFKTHYNKFNLEDAAILQKYENKKLIKDYFLYWNDKEAYLYNGTEKIIQKVNGQNIRVLLIDLMEIDLMEGDINE